MNKNQLLAAATLVTTVVLGVLAGLAVATRAGLLEVLVLFFAGVGAGVSVKALIDTRRSSGKDTGLAKVKATTTSPNGRAQGRRRDRGGRRRSGRGQPSRTTGKVKWFDDAKGFGFITPDNGKDDCFVHRSAIQGARSLPEGKLVEFHIVTDEKGREAAADVVGI